MAEDPCRIGPEAQLHAAQSRTWELKDSGKKYILIWTYLYNIKCIICKWDSKEATLIDFAGIEKCWVTIYII